jgi:hypothetical protein
MKSTILAGLLVTLFSFTSFALNTEQIEQCSRISETIQTPEIKNATAAFTILAFVRDDIKAAYNEMAKKMDKTQTCREVEDVLMESLQQVKTLLEKSPMRS